MFEAMKNKYLVKANSQFVLADALTLEDESLQSKKSLKSELKNLTKELGELQHRLYAENRRSVLCVFQAMDAAGKDSTIRAVFNRVNPTGCHVSSFKKPSSLELDHDFMWRSTTRLPERGQIGIFNRSYYEEALVVRVHPNFLKYQRLPNLPKTLNEKSLSELWENRFETFNDFEKHLARNGTLVLKFWLNVSKEEQKKRFLSRLDEPQKHWKFSSSDLKERQYWDNYMEAYQDLLNNTSKPWAPWYAIPADNKLHMRVQVAKIIIENLKEMNPKYPVAKQDEVELFDEMRAALNSGS
jgi:PPK2 family polyphosphate:nucleotide phosphotransferase